MTTEVQTVEPADAPAVPGTAATTGVCSTDLVAGARRPKRTASLTTEAAELKRPRTAPATPIDPASNGVEGAGIKASDADGSGGAHAGVHDVARPSGAASAPAALPAHRAQAAATTATTPAKGPASRTHGPGSASRHAAAAGNQAVLQQQHQQHQHQSEDQQQGLAGLALPLHLLPPLQHRGAAAAPAGASGGADSSGGGARSGGSARHLSADGSNHHHRHDALEEQVFSPGFHLPTASHGDHTPVSHAAAAASPDSGGAHHNHNHRNAFADGATKMREGKAAPRSDPGAAGNGRAPTAAAAASPALHAAHHHGPTCMQLHAIDLNVVDGVDVDTEDDELQGAGAAGPGSEGAADAAGGDPTGRAQTQGRPASARARRQTREQQQAAGPGAAGPSGVAPTATTTSSVSGGVIAAVGEELSSSSGGAAGCGGKGGQEGEGEEDYSDDDEFDNDENAPLGSPTGGPGSHHTAHQQQQQPQQYHDAVLVASAPRPLVSAALAAAGLATAAAEGGSASAAAAAAATAAGQEDDDEDDEEDDEFVEFDPLVFIKQLPPLEACVPPHRPTLLPKQTRAMARRKTLVLDLDETLVHSSLEAVERSDFNFPVTFNGMEHTVFVRQRPHLHEFMARVAALFEVVVFTASQRIYAERLLDILDPGQRLVRHRIYRDSCVVVDGNYLKDLSVLGRDLAHTIIVDNSPQAFGFQVDNGIPIESWYDDDTDGELLKLLPFLESLAGAEVDDVRPRIHSQFRLRELIDRA